MPSDVTSPAEALKRTPLHPLHAERGARFGPFAGWELPLYYSSILKEHEAVRQRVGLFDVSHLGHLEASGPATSAHLQLLVTQDLLSLEPGKACYTPMLNARGGIMDEMIVYRLEPERFRLVVNASNGDKVLGWLRSRLGTGPKVEDLCQAVGTLALQGPRAAEVLSRVSPLHLASLPRYRITSTQVAERPVQLARTGYTGEDGCEIFVAVEGLAVVWQALLKEGEEAGIQPIGLGARDTLRLEAGLPLGGADLDERTTPLEAGLEWTIEWRKGPFVGRQALEQQRREGLARRLAGFELKEAGVPRGGYAIHLGDEKAGQVTSGTVLAGGRAIGLGYVPPSAARPGTAIFVEIRGRKVPAEVVKLPFYRRQK